VPSFLDGKASADAGLDAGRQGGDTDGDAQGERHESDEQVLDGGHGCVPREINLEKNIAQRKIDVK
jgi:hypothetical protein